MKNPINSIKELVVNNKLDIVLFITASTLAAIGFGFYFFY